MGPGLGEAGRPAVQQGTCVDRRRAIHMHLQSPGPLTPPPSLSGEAKQTGALPAALSCRACPHRETKRAATPAPPAALAPQGLQAAPPPQGC